MTRGISIKDIAELNHAFHMEAKKKIQYQKIFLMQDEKKRGRDTDMIYVHVFLPSRVNSSLV